MFMEAVLSTIVEAMISHVIDKESDQISDKVRDILGRDPAKRALKAALKEAFTNLEKRYPEWTASNFNDSFLAREGAPVLAQFLVMNGHPNASELAARWADSLNIRDRERRTHYISDLEPIAADFLHDLAQRLKKKEALRELNESRALDQIAEDMQALRQRFGADKATFGTRYDYLHWLIYQTLYLDASGTFQTQRQVQLRLDTIYISLQARSNETLSPADDRRIFEAELADLEMEIGSSQLTAEEREDKHDLLQKRLEDRLSKSKAGKVLELAEVINRHDRVVILGDPGSGKTTLLRYLALQHAKAQRDGRDKIDEKIGQTRFPLWIRIAEYAENGIWKQQSVSDFLPSYYARRDCPKRGLADLLESELGKGECLVLLDGLDEIVNADERSGVVRQIDDFVRRHSHKNNRFVITSRIAGYSRAPLNEPFKHYTVCEMNDTQIHHFLERWCQAVEDKETPEISAQERQRVAQREIDGITQALQNPGVHRLAVNPLLLRILALIHRTGARLPQKRIELYKLAVDTLARTWRHAQQVAEAKLYEESALLKEEYLTPLLGELAYWLHTHKPTGIATEREVYEVLGEAYARMNELHWDADNPSPHIQAEIRKFLSAVHTHTGLFVERAPKRYGFLHLTFEEYYVARHLIASSSSKRAKLIRKHLHQPRWEEPILLAIGFVGLDYPKEASELVEGAILAQGEVAEEQGFTPSLYEDILGRDYIFSLRCLSDTIPVRRGLVRQLTRRFATEYCYKTGLARFSRYKQALSEMLTRLVGSESIEVLISHLSSLLRDSQISIPVRSAAAETLGKLKSFTPEVVEALLFFLRDRQVEVEVRNKAIENFAELRTSPFISGPVSPELIMPLLAVLQDSQIEPEVRSEAARALGPLSRSSPQVTEALVAVLQDNQDEPQVRSEAARALGPLSRSSPQVTEALLAFIQDSQIELQVRSEVRRALIESGLSSPKGIEALLLFLRDSQVEVGIRSGIVWALWHLSPEGIKVLSSIFRDNQFEIEVRLRALGVFMELRRSSPEIIEAALAVLRDDQDEPRMRSEVARALGWLGAISSPEITEAALAVLRHRKDNAQVRSEAAETLGVLSISSSEVVKALLVVLQDNQDEPLVRSNVASVLAELKSTSSEPEVVKTLLMVLRDDQDEPQVRSEAAETLGKLSISSPEMVDAWLFFLRDRQVEAQVRSKAILALGMLNDSSSEAVELLLSILRDNQIEAQMYSEAIIALRSLKSTSPEVIEALLSVLRDNQSEARMRNEAIVALRVLSISSPEVVKALLVILQDRQVEPQMRREAARALAKLKSPSSEVIKSLLVLVRDDQDEPLVRRNAIITLQELNYSSPEVVEALLMVLQDSQGELRMRSNAAEALEELEQVKSMCSSDSSIALCEIFQHESSRSRWIIVRILGQLEPTNELILSTLWQGLLDSRIAAEGCMEALVQIGEQQSAFRPLIEKRLLEAITDPGFTSPDEYSVSSASDHAYWGLWRLVVGGDQEE